MIVNHIREIVNLIAMNKLPNSGLRHAVRRDVDARHGSRSGYSTEGDQAGLLPSGAADLAERGEERLVVLREAH